VSLLKTISIIQAAALAFIAVAITVAEPLQSAIVLVP
jgi:hypothetical protein